MNKGDDKLPDPKIPMPKNLDKMLEIAKILSKDFVFARIDLYNINGQIYSILGLYKEKYLIGER